MEKKLFMKMAISKRLFCKAGIAHCSWVPERFIEAANLLNHLKMNRVYSLMDKINRNYILIPDRRNNEIRNI